MRDVIMPERVADAIEKIARPNRDDQQEKCHLQRQKSSFDDARFAGEYVSIRRMGFFSRTVRPKSRTTISATKPAWQHWDR
jgi:hypothetical protein